MAELRDSLKRLLNKMVRPVGARFVGAEWGPRGFLAALRRARAQGFTPATIVDVGASNGQWTRECMQVFPESRYLLVDPLEENGGDLQRMASANPRTRVWTGALGATAGRLDMYTHGDQSSFLHSADFPSGRRSVEVRTLDSFQSDAALAGPMLLKADVQGYELEVLKGASDCLAFTEMLLLEVSFRRMYDNCPLAHEVVAFAGERGFRIYDICNYLQRPADKELAQADLLFVRDGSSLFRHEAWN